MIFQSSLSISTTFYQKIEIHKPQFHPKTKTKSHNWLIQFNWPPSNHLQQLSLKIFPLKTKSNPLGNFPPFNPTTNRPQQFQIVKKKFSLLRNNIHTKRVKRSQTFWFWNWNWKLYNCGRRSWILKYFPNGVWKFFLYKFNLQPKHKKNLICKNPQFN